MKSAPAGGVNVCDLLMHGLPNWVSFVTVAKVVQGPVAVAPYCTWKLPQLACATLLALQTAALYE